MAKIPNLALSKRKKIVSPWGSIRRILLCGKQTTFEGGFRVPTIAWWPTVIKSKSVMSEVGTMILIHIVISICFN